ncbi:ADP-ribosylglycohydrolase family protein [Halobaculum halobium]|uniref:ADP-ribosylglycohydrolase family protein n=1 Tax=Halobaculum halobium TaxID=3032281 RepID=A0ABD5T8R3_9EURY|nr:ADP-ribosylglycohydrolase family protein [Halobaculum sp. SYNS20]
MTNTGSDRPGDRAVDSRARARGCLLGLACGDALGRPVDGDAGAAVRDRYGRVTEQLGADGRPAGTTTEPTAAAVAVADRLLRRDDQQAISTGAASGGAIPPEPAAHPGTLLAAAVPYGLVDATAADRAALAAAATTRVERATADDPAAETCAALATIIGELIGGASVENAVSTAMGVAVDRGSPVALRETLAVVGDRGAVTIDARGDQSALFETALHEAVAAADAEEAIVSAVSRGGHASTLGAVAGAVSGARFGEDAIPARWVNELDESPDVRSLGASLTEIARTR